MKCFACQAEITEPLPDSGVCPHCGADISRLSTIEDLDPHGRKTLPGDEVAAAQAEEDRDGSETTALPPSGSATMSETVETADDSHIDPRNVLSIHPRVFGALPDASDGGPKSDYSLLSVLGEGGMGVVYRAQQNSVGRAVALKMLRESGASDAQEEGFLSEVVVTGELEHPNIVPVYDLGRTSKGELFYAMRQVHGTPWSEVLKEKSLHENLEILLRVSDAVAFAHSKGVVHRDIKPENVMLGDFGEVILMDWGLAFVTGDFDKLDTVRRSKTLGCTPAYAAPELAIGPAYLIGPASDVYLLGATLYEILSGNPPHVGQDFDECLENLVRNYIKPTDQKGELVEIAMRAMRTQPEDRYASVMELQQAIRDYQSHYESLAISSRAEEDLARARRRDNAENYDDFSQAMFRFREAVNLWDGNTEAHAGLHTARFEYARTALDKGDLDLGESLLDRGDPRHQPLFDEIRRAKDARAANARKLKTARNLARVAAIVVIIVLSGASYYSNLQRREADTAAWIAVQQGVKAQIAKEAAEVSRVEAVLQRENARQAEQRALQSAQDARAAQARAVVSAEQAQESEKLAKHQEYLARIALANENIRNNAFTDAERILKELRSEQEDKLGWEWNRLDYLTRQSLETITASSRIQAMAFAPNNGWFVSGGSDGTITRHARGEGGRWQPVGSWTQASAVNALAVSPAGVIASCGDDAQISLWNAEGKPLRTLNGHTQAVTSLEFSEDGKRLLSTSRDHTARLWRVSTGIVLQVLDRHSWWVWDAAFCSSHSSAAHREDHIITVGQDGKAIVWMRSAPDEPYTERGVFLHHDGPVFTVAAAAGASLVASGGADGRILLWNAMDVEPVDLELRIRNLPEPPIPMVTLDGHQDVVREVRFSPNGKWLLSGSDDNTARVWDIKTGIVEKVLRGHGGAVNAVAFDSDGDLIVSGGSDAQVKLWDKDAYTEVRVFQDAILQGHRDGVLSVAFANQSERFVTCSRDHTARVWDASGEQPLHVLAEGHEFLASTAIFLRDETLLLTCALDNTARLWDVVSGAERAVMEGTGNNAVAAVSPDGRWIVTGSALQKPASDFERRTQDATENGTETTAPLGTDELDETEQVYAALLWSTADVLAAAQAGQPCTPRAVLWDHQAPVSAAAFAPDSQRFVTGDDTGRGVIWDAASGTLLRRLQGRHSGRIQSVAIVELENRPWIVTASTDKSVSQWDLQTGQERRSHRLVFPNAVLSMDLSAERQEAIVLSFTTRIENEREVRDHTVYRCPLTAESFTPRPVARVPAAAVSCVAYGHEPDTAITVETGAARGEQAIRLWDLTTGTERRVTQPDGQTRPLLDARTLGGTIFAARFSNDGQRILAVGGKSARILDPVQQNLQMVFSPHSVVAGADYTFDDRFIVTVGQDLAVKIWNAETGRTRVRVTDAHRRSIHAVDCSPLSDRYEFVTAGDDGLAVVWSYDPQVAGPESVRRVHELQHADAQRPNRIVSVRFVAYSPDGAMIATGTDHGLVTLWNARTGMQLATATRNAPITSVAFSQDSTHLISASGNEATLWQRTGDGGLALTHRLQGHTSTINTVAFSPDGSRVLTGSSDTSIKLWDPTTGEEVLTLRRHLDDVTTARFSHSGDSVLSGSLDGTAILWLTQLHNQKAAVAGQSDWTQRR